MIKKDITYETLDGNLVTETFYFHLSKTDIMEIEVSYPGGLEDYFGKVLRSGDNRLLMLTFKDFVGRSIGRRSEDGKRFIRSEAIRDEFLTSDAYAEFMVGLFGDGSKAAEFIAGLIPKKMAEDVRKSMAIQIEKDSTSDNPRLDPVMAAQMQKAFAEKIETERQVIMNDALNKLATHETSENVQPLPKRPVYSEQELLKMLNELHEGSTGGVTPVPKTVDGSVVYPPQIDRLSAGNLKIEDVIPQFSEPARVDIPEQRKSIEQYTDTELLNMSNEEFNALAGTDIQKMPQSTLKMAYRRKLSGK